MALGYITQHKDYWIAPNAVNITLNALGEANRIQGSVASGAVIMCWIDGITELGYDNGHEYRRWPLSLSPTYFNTDTAKYVYAAVPRSATIGSQAVIVFPSEQLDINGKNASEQQIGSTDYLYIYLHGIISEVLTENGSTIRKWTLDPRENWGQLDTAAARDAQKNTTDWYHYDQSTQLVSFLKGIVMSATSWFQNLRLGNKNLTGVATADTSDVYADSDEMVATPGFVKSRYLSKTTDDQAQGNIEFLKDVTVRGNTQTDGDMAVGGDANIGGLLQVVKDVIAKAVRSWNYTGDGVADTGFNLTDNDGTGHSKLVVDNLLVRMKATFIEMEIKELSAVAGDFVFSQASGRIEEVHYLDADGHTIGIDKVNVPWLVRMLPMAVQRRWMLGRRQEKQRQWSKLTESERNSVKNFRCFLRSDDGTTRLINTWRVGDLARCQTLDIQSTTRDDGTRIAGRGQGEGADSIDRHQTQGNVFYWRRVNVAAVTTTGTRQRCYVDLGNNDEGDDFYADSDIPCAGDNIVCFGNDTDATRQGLVIIETTGTDAPAIKEYRGIGNRNNTGGKWSLNNRLKTKISPTTGNRFVAPSFVIETDDGDRDLGGKNLIDYHDWYDNIHKTNTDDDDYHESIFVRVEDEVFDVYSPIVYLKKGRYCFSAYMRETVDDEGYTVDDVFIQAKKSSKYSEDYGQYTDVQTDSTDEGDGWIKGTFNLTEDCFVVLEIGTGTEFIFEYGLEINKIQLERGSNRTEYTTYYIPQNTDSRFEVTRGSIEMKVSDSEGKTNRRIQTVEGTVSEVQNAVASPNLLDNNKWKNNDTGAIILPDTNGRVFFPSGVDLDSESLSLKAGTYVFSFYALKDEEHPMGLMPRALLNNDDEIALQVKAVQDTEECRYYGTFFLATDQSIHIVVSYEDSTGIEYIKHAQLEVGSYPSRYVAKGLVNTASFVEQTADEINMSVRDDLGEVGININGSDKNIKLIGDKVGFVGSDGKKEYIKVGIDTSGLPYFIFLDKDGNEAYNLGWGGLQQIANNSVADKWYGTILTNKITDGLEVQPSDIPALYGEMIAPHNPKWRFTEGYIVNAQGNRIYNISKTSEPSSYNNSYLNSKATVQQSGSFVPSDPIADGWYAENAGSYGELSLFYTNGGEVVYSGFIISLGHDQRVVDGVVSYEHYSIKISGNGYSSVGHRTTKGTAVIADSPVVFPSYI